MQPKKARPNTPYRKTLQTFFAIDGDVRVHHDTIIVTCYNAPDVDNLKVDFRCK